MNPSWYPLIFEPIYKDYLWGGSRIAQRFNRTDTPDPCAESWECSTRPEGMSVVRNGALAGIDLKTLIRRHAGDVLGSRDAGDDFPLLIKIIDAHQRLSVQVHPNNQNAATVGGEPKTEAWYILDAAPDAYLYCGLQPGVTRDQLAHAVQGGRTSDVVPLLQPHRVSGGDVVFVPGGRVHAIGSGILLLEVQQNSNTTYRLFDWERVGADGKPRELHIDNALAVIDWDDTGQTTGTTTPPPDPAVPGVIHPRVTCPWFVIEETTLVEPMTIRNTNGVHVWFTMEGNGAVHGGADTVNAVAGDTLLIPAALDTYTITPTGNRPVRALRITLPAKREFEEAS